jgi:hypothetical protein
MQTLLDLLLDLVLWLIPWPWHRDESRSVVGESDMDRSMRRFWIWLLAVVLVLAAGVALWLHFRG